MFKRVISNIGCTANQQLKTKRLQMLEKNYIIDLGFRNMLLGYRDADRGYILENVVYLELLRRQSSASTKVDNYIANKALEKPSAMN